MDQQQIKACIDAMSASDVAEMQFSQDGWTLRLVRGGRRATARRSANAPPKQQSRRDEILPETPVAAPEICAPLSGIVYLSPSPNQPPFVVVGQAVTAGTVLCVIEAMKTFNEIRAERDGVIEAMLVASESLVDAGQPLMRIT